MKATANTLINKTNEEILSLRDTKYPIEKIYNILKEKNSGLINKIIFKFSSLINTASRQFYCIQRSDIIAEAELAFFNAVRTYERCNDSKFASWAYLYITGAIKNLLNRQVNRNNYTPDTECDDQKRDYMIVSMSAEYAEDIKIEDTISDDQVHIEEHVGEKIKRDSVAMYLNELETEERNLVSELFGIGCTERSCTDIGSELGISKSAVSQRKFKILDKLASKREKVEKLALHV